MKKILHYVLIAFLMMPLVAISQDGNPDTSFGDNGFVQTDLSGGTDFAYGLAQMADGKLLVSGGKEGVFPWLYPAIVQYNTDGSLSTSFGGNGIVAREVGTDYGFYTHIGAQSDGKVIAAGSLGPFGNRILYVNRYLANGDPDLSFGTNGDLIPFNSINESSQFAVLDDDSFLVANPVTDGGTTIIQLKKYLADGILDNSFGTNGTALVEDGGQSNAIYDLEVASNGNIVVAGNIQVGGIYLTSLVRLLPDGTKDTSFGNNGAAPLTEFTDYTFQSLALFENGRVAVLQTLYDAVDEVLFTRITRYNADGIFDDSFGTSGQGFIDPNLISFAFRDLLIQPNQRLLLYGNFSDPLEGGGPTRIRRYHTNGGTDSNFFFDSATQGEIFAQKIMLQEDGKLVCLGTTPWYNGPEDFVVERYNNSPLGISEFETTNVSAFPNPTTGIVTLTYDFLQSVEVLYQVNDISGKLLMEGVLRGNRHEVDLSGFGSGLYFLNTPNTTLRLIRE